MKTEGLNYMEAMCALLRGDCIQYEDGTIYKLMVSGYLGNYKKSSWDENGFGISNQTEYSVVPDPSIKVEPDPSVVNWGPHELLGTVLGLRDDDTVSVELFEVLLEIAEEIHNIKKGAK